MTDYSYQLYSSRKTGRPLAETLNMIARLGYAEAEGYATLYADPSSLDTLKGALADNGLTMPTGHFGWDMVRTEPGRCLEIARALNMRVLFVPAVGPDLRKQDAKGWESFGLALAEAGKPFWDAGLAFGWHNHAFEFADIGIRETPLDLILAGSERLALQFDVAWAVKGGADPFALMRTYRHRLMAAHVKDMAPEGTAAEDGWADVGLGVMDWRGLMRALKANGCKYFVMEHDNPSDDSRFAGRSIAALKAM